MSNGYTQITCTHAQSSRGVVFRVSKSISPQDYSRSVSRATDEFHGDHEGPRVDEKGNSLGTFKNIKVE